MSLIIALHALLLWALSQVPAVRQAVLETAPIFVNLIPPDAAPAPPPPPKAPVVAPRAPPLMVSKAAPAPAATFVVEPPPIEPPTPAPAAPVEVAAPAPVEVAPAPAKVIPASGVQYLTPPPLEYPRASRRMGESGRVLVRVYIDEEGLPRDVQVNQSSGHPRLDEAAVTAVNKARFKPYTENGCATAGWAFIPLTFDLEK